MIRSTHTYAILSVSHAAYAEIKSKLTDAGYTDQFHDNRDGDGIVIDMHGIALSEEGEHQMPDQIPSVGRMVHYQSYGTPKGEYKPLPRAAVITEVDADGSTVGLCVLNPTGQFFNQHVKFSPDPEPGCWNWPPRV